MTRTRIAILGGGVGAMTAAYHLTSAPDWRDRYEVTVYQLGWRLGGKGASGRNRERADRIEEHGLHLFLGFYDNAFALMQRLYGEMGRAPDAPLARWDQAWQPHSYFVLEEDLGDRALPWEFRFPAVPGVPGQGAELPAPWQMLRLLLGWAREIFERTAVAPAQATVTPDRLDRILRRARDQLAAATAAVSPAVGRLRRLGLAAIELVAGASEALIASTFLHAAEHHAAGQSDDAGRHSRADHDLLLWLLRTFIAWLKRHWAAQAANSSDIRRALISLDALTAVVVGMITDGLVAAPVDWFKIDGASFEDWLIQHGADRASTVAPPVLLLRQLVFAHATGVGAGTCLHYALRMIYAYRGAFAYKMQAGMGDAVFAPFFAVLSARGVRFEFFQSVDELRTGRDRDGNPVIDEVAIAVQAQTVDGAPYRPLVDIAGLPCWPSEPLYDQLVQGEALRASGENLENWWTRWQPVARRVLRRGVDFDQVVLGISIGAYPYICKQLIAETAKFRRMVDTVAVIETQAAQLWLSRGAADLGWQLGPDPIVGTAREPFDTIADMSHLLPRERWSPSTAAGVLYLTAPLSAVPPPVPPRDDARYPLDQLARVHDDVARWLETRASGLLPRALSSRAGAPRSEVDWQLLADPAGTTGPDRLAAQFIIGCWNPSDRYVLSVPGSAAARLPSAGAGYRNLVMAGDWTRTGLGAGCVEAAVMSGMHAARALCGSPARIVGDDLPDGDDVPPPAPPPRRGRYIEIDGNNTPRQPYTARGVTMYSFVLEADPGRLQAVCDQQLNLGGPLIYRPLGPFALFVAATMGPISPAAPAAWLDEQDFGFWIPVVAGTRSAGGEFHAVRPAFFIPYLWVDSGLASQAGREVFGYPKGVARLVAPGPAGGTGAAEFSIDALVLPAPGAPGAPDARWQWRRLVTAARRGGGFPAPVRELASFAALGRAVASAIARQIGSHALPAPTLDLLRSAWRDVAGLEVPMVFLKQFRDAADGTMACYQAIVEAANRVTDDPIEAGVLPGDWELAIAQFADVRVIDHLGLRVRPGEGAGDGAGVVPAALHFWVKFGFVAEPGRVVWRAV